MLPDNRWNFTKLKKDRCTAMASNVIIDGLDGIMGFEGKVLFELDGFSVSQEEIEDFCRSVKNTEWIHWDLERTKSSRFGGTILPAFFIPAYFSHLFFSIVEFHNVENMLFSGVDKMRLLAPIRTGAPINLVVTVGKIESRDRGIRVLYDLQWREKDSISLSGVATFVLRYW